MKTLLTIILLLTFTKVYCQDSCSAIIDWQYLGRIDILEQPEGKVIHQMKNDSINEDFLHLEILNQEGNYFYVSIYFAMNEEEKTIGWIKKADYIGAFKRNEKFPMDLTLYKKPKESKKNKVVVKSWNPGLLKIEKCSGNWVLVSFKQDNKRYKGWIEANELCANAYSTCS